MFVVVARNNIAGGLRNENIVAFRQQAAATQVGRARACPLKLAKRERERERQENGRAALKVKRRTARTWPLDHAALAQVRIAPVHGCVQDARASCTLATRLDCINWIEAQIKALQVDDGGAQSIVLSRFKFVALASLAAR